MTIRTTFLVDGFNLYHSVQDILNYKSQYVKWLDISSLCSSYLHLVNSNAKLEQIYYFTAFASHLLDLSIIRRHKTYIKCLKATGVIEILGRFKPKTIKCPNCNQSFTRYEEKETDVSIGTKLFELLFKKQCDCVILVTGDTDLAASVETAQLLFPNIDIRFAFPYKRHNSELKLLAPKSFKNQSCELC